jgi:methionine sulfoxide reductase heme-binding subunit
LRVQDTDKYKVIRWAKVVIFLACLGPLARLGWKAYNGLLGANPIEVITHSTGDWTLIFLCVTLAVTPLRMLTKQYWLIRFRRMLGLFAMFYGTLHFTTYIWLDKFFDVHEMVKDVAKRPFITMGFTAFVLMIPLAITSTRGWISRLGGKRWNLLHRLIYFSAIAGVIHYVWLVKKDLTKPLEYAAVVTVLLGYRLAVWAIPLVSSKRLLSGKPVAVEESQA